MTDKQAQSILYSLAQGSEGYREAEAEYAALLPEEAALPERLAADVLRYLSQDPETAEAVDYYTRSQEETRAFGAELILTAGAVLSCAMFLLRSHIKFEKDKEGKTVFKFEHKPADNDLLVKIVDALAKLFDGKSGA